MVVTLEALWLVVLLTAFYLGAKLILTPAIVGVLRHIPGVGRLLVGAANAVVNTVEDAIAKWIRPHLSTILKWLKAATIATLSLPLAMVYYGPKVEAALKHLVEVKILAMIHGITDPIRRISVAAANAVKNISADLAKLDKRLTHGIEQGLKDLGADLLARFRAGIDTLRKDVFNHAIPGLEKDIADAARKAEAEIAAVGKTVTGVAHDVADLAKRLDVPVSLLESLIATLGIVGALQALETLGKCEGKMRILCSYDPQLWQDFLIATLSILAFPGLREMARMGASLMEDVSGVVMEIAES